ncbi:MAG: hypothetical protein HYS74_00295 [Parcubacteria group bacterium]|nr:hypothetical protein [Parcubacteria group bacterium]
MLFAISAAGIVALGALSPILVGSFAAAYTAQQKIKKRDFNNRVQYLKRRGYIRIEKKRDGYHLSLTREGKKKVAYYKLQELSVKRPKKWDGIWRIVFFDIPTSDHWKRAALREQLHVLDFYQLQKSVWVHPFDCEDEVLFVKNHFNIADDHLRIIYTDDLGDDGEIKKYYKL